MSLQLHYTGQDYTSRGLLNTELTPGSTSAIVGGCKTGKGFAFDGTVNSALIGKGIIEDKPNMSFSFWYKHGLSSASKQTLFCLQGDTTGTNNTRLLTRVSNDNVYLVVRPTTQIYINKRSNTTLLVAKWYHLTFILEENESKVSLYVNGVYDIHLNFDGTLASSNQPVVLGKRAISNNIEPLLGQICNFKYYNHVLSAREIAEDYKSLILHYPLKNENEISPYIALEKETSYFHMTVFTRTIVDDFDKLTYSRVGGSTHEYPSARKKYDKYIDGGIYSLTITFRINIIINIHDIWVRNARRINDTSSGNSFVLIHNYDQGVWHTITLTQMMSSADPNVPSVTFAPLFELIAHSPNNNIDSSLDIDIKDIYVTEGTSILPYPIYNRGYIFDHSGFNRHITNLTNTVTLDSKSQVYSASLKNDGTQSLVGTCDLTDLNGLDEGSFSFRVFLTANTGTDQYVIYNMTDMIDGNGITFTFRYGLGIAYFCGKRIQFNYTPTVDAWHHIVLVKTSTQIKVYIDNVSIYTVSAATSSKNFSNITSVSCAANGLSPITEGNVQDIRFYATALTEQDVKDLYNVRHSIDKDSNCYTYELIEGQTGVGMKKNGQTNCDEVIENEDGSFSIKSDKTIKVNNIKEI